MQVIQPHWRIFKKRTYPNTFDQNCRGSSKDLIFEIFVKSYKILNNQKLSYWNISSILIHNSPNLISLNVDLVSSISAHIWPWNWANSTKFAQNKVVLFFLVNNNDFKHKKYDFNIADLALPPTPTYDDIYNP